MKQMQSYRTNDSNTIAYFPLTCWQLRRLYTQIDYQSYSKTS